MRERIEVRGSRPVNARIADAIHYRAGSVGGHGPLDRTRVVNLPGGAGITGERNREALLHQCRGLFALGWSNKIERSHFIIFAPTSPIREFFLPTLILGLGRKRMKR